MDPDQLASVKDATGVPVISLTNVKMFGMLENVTPGDDYNNMPVCSSMSRL